MNGQRLAWFVFALAFFALGLAVHSYDERCADPKTDFVVE